MQDQIPEQVETLDRLRVLVVDDDPLLRTTLTKLLGFLGCEAQATADAEETFEVIRQAPFDLVFLDYMMPRINGLEVLRWIKEHDPRIQVVLMTAYGSIKQAVEAMKMGTLDYITKPFERVEILRIVESAAERKRLRLENLALRRELQDKYKFHNLIGISSAMQGVLELVVKASRSEATVLIQGESGTGKEVVARAIHYSSQRAGAPFVPIDCSAMNANLIESELFGHTKGAFTGADRDKVGLFKTAHGGSLFLDEIGEMVFEVQAKLLRAIQERTIKPVGATSSLRVDVRIIGATNRDLNEQIRRHEFREDLFHRMNVIAIDVPPLRDRLDDLPLLVAHFLKRYATEDRPVSGIDPEALACMQRHAWPGNVRELENAVERAVALGTTDRLEVADLPPAIREWTPGAGGEAEGQVSLELTTLQEMERRAIVQALRQTGGDKEAASRILGIDRSTLYRKVRRFERE